MQKGSVSNIGDVFPEVLGKGFIEDRITILARIRENYRDKIREIDGKIESLKKML